MLLISELLPKVQELQASRHKTSAIADYLSTVSLKDILPETPVPTPRRFLVSVRLSCFHSNVTTETVV
jgi:hypothetical protein